jgi:hypothetical protein
VWPVAAPGEKLPSSLTIANFDDFIYGTNTDPAKRNTADSVFVFDAAYSAAYTIQLPAGAVSFNAPQEVAGANWLLATVTNKTAGDGGFVQFDLEAGTASLFPIPTGITAVELVGTFLATDKMVARAWRKAPAISSCWSMTWLRAT